MDFASIILILCMALTSAVSAEEDYSIQGTFAEVKSKQVVDMGSLKVVELKEASPEGCGMSEMAKCYRVLPEDGTPTKHLIEEIESVEDAHTCQLFCKELYAGICTWFMFDKTTKDCKLFDSSITDLQNDCQEAGYAVEPTYTECDTVFEPASDNGCYNFREDYCRFEFSLMDNLEQIKSIAECQTACRYLDNCKYFLYDAISETCKLNTATSEQRNCDIIHGTPEPTLQSCLEANKLPWANSTDLGGGGAEGAAEDAEVGTALFSGLKRDKLTHGKWDTNSWTYNGPACGSGEEVFLTEKTKTGESAYLDTCFGGMPKQFLIYNFESMVTLTKYSWSGQGGECPTSWTVYGTNDYPDGTGYPTVMTLVDTESGHTCQTAGEMIDFSVDETVGSYQYYVWIFSEMDKGNSGNTDGYRWTTIQLFTG